MAGISGLGAVMSSQQIEMQRSVKTAKLVKDVAEMQGEMALKLLDSAQVDGTGQNLNIQV